MSLSPTSAPSLPVGDNETLERLRTKGSPRWNLCWAFSGCQVPGPHSRNSWGPSFTGPQTSRKLTGWAQTVIASTVVSGQGDGNVSQITGSDPRLRTVCRCPGPFNKLPQMLKPVSALSMLPG